MPSGPPSLFLSADHFAVVALTLVLCVASCALARRNLRARWIPWFMGFLAAAQLSNALATQAWLAWTGRWTPGGSLPCQLCDAAIAASVVSMLRPSALSFELTYFWGLGAALQGLITPAIVERWPHPIYVQFFIVHCGLPLAAVFLAFGLGLTPRPRVVLRMMIWTNVVALVAGVTSWLTGGNYMFMRAPPPTGSVLDFLGPWPWYLLVAELVAFGVFAALAIPFVLRRRRAPAGIPA